MGRTRDTVVAGKEKGDRGTSWGHCDTKVLTARLLKTVHGLVPKSHGEVRHKRRRMLKWGGNTMKEKRDGARDCTCMSSDKSH